MYYGPLKFILSIYDVFVPREFEVCLRLFLFTYRAVLFRILSQISPHFVSVVAVVPVVLSVVTRVLFLFRSVSVFKRLVIKSEYFSFEFLWLSVNPDRSPFSKFFYLTVHHSPPYSRNATPTSL